MKITIKRNDTARLLQVTLKIGTAAIDLTNANSVSAIFSAEDGTVVTQAAIIIDPPEDGVVQCAIPLSVSTVVGKWNLEWEITYIDGKELSVPSVGYDSLIINPDLA